MTKYTVVQHSGFGYKGDEQFERGLESRMLTGKREINLVERVGGILFDTYGEAEDFCEDAMYPDNSGLIPNAQGTFSESATIDDLRIYIPVRKVVG